MTAINRRAILRLGGAAAVSALLAGCGPAASHAEPEVDAEASHSPVTTPQQALARLEHGNARFVRGNAVHPAQGTKYRAELAAAQHPFATIVSCVDSRVPPELIFDAGLGDLFVSRTAGHVIDHAVLGSVQYGVHHLHTPLIVVLGHTNCGAVKATVEALEKNSPASGTDIDALVAAIKPAVLSAEDERPKDLLAASISANVRSVAGKLTKAPVIATAVAEQKLLVLGAQYDLATGKVTILE